MLGTRRGRLEAEVLDRTLPADSTECVEVDRLGGAMSVRICSPSNKLEVS